MKAFRFTILLFICAAVLLSCSDILRNDKDIAIQVHDDPDRYEFSAIYPVSRMGDVQDYINENMQPNGLFASTHDYFNVDTKLQDGTKFHVKSSPGKMDIVLIKHENSTESYHRIKKMSEGIKNILAKK